MAEVHSPPNAPIKRCRYVTDPKMQFGFAGRLLVPLACVAALMGAAVYFALSRQETPTLGATEVRDFLFLAIGVYFVLAAACMLVVSLLLTHRIAGPAYVIRNALDGLLEGDATKRLSLREYDYLQGIASRLSDVRHGMQQEKDKHNLALAQLHLCLARGDMTEAEQIVCKLRGVPAARVRYPGGSVEHATPPPAPEPSLRQATGS